LRQERRFLQTKSQVLQQICSGGKAKLDLSLIWDDGVGRNRNAALTRFRRFDGASAVSGFIGAYPNAIYRVGQADLPALCRAIAGMASQADYHKLADRFAVRRTTTPVWAVKDALHDAHAAWAASEAALFDFNRFRNR
jgi:hypothetical protein